MSEQNAVTPQQECDDLITRVQAIKAPLDEARTKAQEKAGALRRSAAEKAQALKEEIKKAHDDIAPLDELMRSAMAAKRLRGAVQAKAVEQIKRELDKLS